MRLDITDISRYKDYAILLGFDLYNEERLVGKGDFYFPDECDEAILFIPGLGLDYIDVSEYIRKLVKKDTLVAKAVMTGYRDVGGDYNPELWDEGYRAIICRSQLRRICRPVH
jgi:hypothetical protein